MAAIAWVYPRGPEIADPKSVEMTAYAARVGMELGADIVKVYNPGNVGALRWVGLSAGRTKVVISGGDQVSKEDYLNQVKDVMRAELAGIAVGRNVWQSEDPVEVAKALKEIVYNGKY
jgi:class I fructose-bisphosphate aldolase